MISESPIMIAAGVGGHPGIYAVHGDHLRRPVRDRIAAFINAAVQRAISARDNNPRLGSREVRPLERQLHLAAYRPGHEQNVGMTRRSHEVDAEPLDVVDRIRQRGAFPLAGIARTRVYVPDPERPFKDCINLSLKVNNLQRLLRGDGKPFREWKGFLFGNQIF